MHKFNLKQTLGEIVSILPRAADIFNELNIDFYFRGDRTLSEVIVKLSLNEEKILTELDNMYSQSSYENDVDYTTLAPNELIDLLIHNHHKSMRVSLTEMNELSKQVIRGNGPSRTNFFDVHEKINDLRVKLEDGLTNREKIFYPLIIRYFQAPGTLLLEKMHEEINRMKDEHEYLQKAHEELIEISRNNNVPQNELSSYWMIFRNLNEIDENLSFQAHLINNVILKKNEFVSVSPIKYH